jgi:ABC-type bacteriocin/lantibiotic exporter with double-glycine peptidase domain
MPQAQATRTVRHVFGRCTVRLSASVLPIARDSWSFLKLLAATLASLPADVLAASIVINLLGLALPLAILQVYDRVIPHSATATLTFLVLGTACALVLEMVLRIARSYVIAWRAMKVTWETNAQAASRIATAPANLVDAVPAARWIQRLQAVATVSEFQISPARLVLVDLPFVAIFLALLAASSGWLALVPLVVFLLFGITAIARGLELRKATTERMSAEAKIRDFLMEALNGIVTAKALGMEQQILRRFERLSEQAAGCTYNVVRLADNAQSYGSMVSILTQIATATVGAVLVINGQVSIGVVACGTMLAGRIIQPLLRLVAAWNEIQGVMVAIETAKPVLDLPDAHRPTLPAGERQKLPARLIFDNVTFAHQAGRTPVLAEASLEVLPGEIVAISGRDGCGKSTAGRLAAGQLIPQKGQIWIDRVAASMGEARLRGTVAVVNHQSATVRGTVLNNLTMFRDAERLEAAREAARVIGLESSINRLPRGYDTRLGDSASETLPTGLVQRIAIARAIASNPRLLILDEANTAFDYASDLALTNGLLTLRGRITIVLITSRPSFAAIANRVFTLVDGRFQQIETHSQPDRSIKSAGGSA